jgi:hypothetical protein
MTSRDELMQLAAQAWCTENTQDRVMDPELAEAFADILEREASVFGRFKRSIVTDRSYAWSWHCNVAVCYADEGATHEQSNRAASRFMYNAFGLKMETFDEWKSFDWCDEKP